MTAVRIRLLSDPPDTEIERGTNASRFAATNSSHTSANSKHRESREMSRRTVFAIPAVFLLIAAEVNYVAFSGSFEVSLAMFGIAIIFGFAAYFYGKPKV